MAEPVVELRGLTRTFPGEPPIPALRPTDLVIEVGDYVSVVGPSGSGKSTLLHLFGLLDRPTEGTYLLDGIDTWLLSDSRTDGPAGRPVGVRVPGVPLVGASVDGGERDGGHALPAGSAAERRRPGDRGVGAGGSGPPDRAFAVEALRRGASAGGDRPGARAPSPVVAGRRTDRQPRHHDLEPRSSTCSTCSTKVATRWSSSPTIQRRVVGRRRRVRITDGVLAEEFAGVGPSGRPS